MWLASLVPGEPSHLESRATVVTLLERRVHLHQPTLFVIEVCATVARRTRDRQLAVEAGRAVLRWPFLAMHELGHEMAATAADIAATYAVRGADAVYLATALSTGTTLITLDHEMHERGGAVVPVASPSEWLEALP